MENNHVHEQPVSNILHFSCYLVLFHLTSAAVFYVMSHYVYNLL
jgi:hypothetical protein